MPPRTLLLAGTCAAMLFVAAVALALLGYSAFLPSRATAGEPRRGPPGGHRLIKPTIADTVRGHVYADNWFMLYLNGRPVAIDPIDFLPHNVVSFDFLPEYPLTIAVLAKDNADPRTGLEYGTQIGDGGFILKFADGTVTNASWKVRVFSRGPLDRDIVNPRVEPTPLPENWFAVDFDDRAWDHATEYTGQRIGPKEPFYQADFAGARWIWSSDLDLDNTVIFRTRIEKPGWTPRWQTQPNLDTSGVPQR